MQNSSRILWTALTDLTADVLDIMEPQRPNNILLHIVNPPGGTRLTGSTSSAIGAGSAADNELVLALESFPIPKTGQGTIEMAHLNEKRKFAGSPTFEDMPIVYKGLVSAATLSILVAWRKLVYDPATGKIGFATGTAGGDSNGYKRNGYVVSYSSRGDVGPAWNIVGAWPSNLDPGDANQAEGDSFTNVSLTLVLDKVFPITQFTTPPADYQPAGSEE